MRTYETYKDSGLGWLGRVPEHWGAIKIKYLFSFGRGLNITKADLVEEGTPVISYGQIHSKTNTGVSITNELLRFVPCETASAHPENKVHVGDFVFADTSEDKDGCGNCVYIDREGIYAGYHSLVLDGKGRNNKYFAYLFKSEPWRIQIRSKASGVKVFSITQSILSESTIILPPLPEQQSIASYLDHKVRQIDVLIAEKEKMAADLKAYRSSVITEAVTKGLDKNVEMKESGVEWIGKIPAKWHTLQVKYILENCKDALRVGPFGSALAGNDIVSDGNIWIYNQRVVLDNNFKKNDSFIKNEKFAELSAFTVREGDILLTTRGTIGKVAIVPQDAAPGVLHPCIIKFRINDNIVGRDFIKYIFNDTEIITNQVRYNSNSTTIDVIYSYTLKELVLPIPSITEQRDIVRSLDRKIATIDRAIKEQEHQLSDLKSYKSALITEAVTGKIDLRGWEQQKE